MAWDSSSDSGDSWQEDAMAMWREQDGFVKTALPAQSKYWMFVVWPDNLEYTTEKIEESLTAGTRCGANNRNEIVAVRIQEEVSPTSGKHHLQGWIQFASKIRKQAVADLLYWDKSVALLPSLVPEAGYYYCMKEETRPDEYWEHEDGDPMFPAQKISSAAASREAQKKSAQMERIEQMRDIIRNSVSKEEAENKCMDFDIALKKQYFPDCWKYVQNEETIATAQLHRDRYNALEYNPWQRALDEVLQLPADRRKVEVVISRHGDVGKSYFIDMYKARHPKEAVVEMLFGKGNDMFNLIFEKIKGNNEPRVLFIDCSRFHADKANLGVIESIKNGKVINHKYNTGSYTFKNSPHIVIFSNKDFDWDQMSRDRWRIWELEPNMDEMAKYALDMKENTHFAELWKNCGFRVTNVHRYSNGHSAPAPEEAPACPTAPGGYLADFAPQTYPRMTEDSWVRVNAGKFPHQYAEKRPADDFSPGSLFKRRKEFQE